MGKKHRRNADNIHYQTFLTLSRNTLFLLHATIHAKLLTPLLTSSNFTYQQALNLTSDFFTRLDQVTLGRSKPILAEFNISTDCESLMSTSYMQSIAGLEEATFAANIPVFCPCIWYRCSLCSLAAAVNNSTSSVWLLDNSRIRQLADCQLADWTTRGLDISRTRQVADWTTRGCHWRLCVLSFRSFGDICETASCPVRELAIRELAYPRVV